MKHCATAYSHIPWYAKPIQLVLRFEYAFFCCCCCFFKQRILAPIPIWAKQFSSHSHYDA